MSSVTRCESLQSIHHTVAARMLVTEFISIYRDFYGGHIMALLLSYYTNSMRFRSVARGALRAINKYHFYKEACTNRMSCRFSIYCCPRAVIYAPVNVSAMGTSVKKKKCLQSQSVIRCPKLYCSTNSESLRRKVHLDCDRMYRPDCK